MGSQTSEEPRRIGQRSRVRRSVPRPEYRWQTRRRRTFGARERGIRIASTANQCRARRGAGSARARARSGGIASTPSTATAIAGGAAMATTNAGTPPRAPITAMMATMDVTLPTAAARCTTYTSCLATLTCVATLSGRPTRNIARKAATAGRASATARSDVTANTRSHGTTGITARPPRLPKPNATVASTQKPLDIWRRSQGRVAGR